MECLAKPECVGIKCSNHADSQGRANGYDKQRPSSTTILPSSTCASPPSSNASRTTTPTSSWSSRSSWATAKRQICAGLRQHYQPEELVGKQIVVVANLAPRQMRGETSQGMLLAATDPATNRVIVVTPAEQTAPGSKVS